MKMTDADESALLAIVHAIDDLHEAFAPTAELRRARDYLRARLAADQQKGGGEVACHRWLRNGESTPSGWISGEPSARQIEAQQMCKEKFGDTADWQVEYAYKAPQPSIPAPAQQDGKASGGEVDDAMVERALTALSGHCLDCRPHWHESDKEQMRELLLAALAHPPHADQDQQP